MSIEGIMAQPKIRQEVVSSLLTKITQRDDLPALSEHIHQVMEVVEDDERSMRQITEVILKDVSFSMQVLRRANSAEYNRSGRELATITHAVSLIGLDAVRNLASGMLLLQHFWERSAGARELMVLSLLTAGHARATARRVQYGELEEAYLCGMFRNFGEILVSSYLPRKYATILQRMQRFGADEHAAALRVLECTYEDFGRAALRHWRLPDRMRLAIQTERAQRMGPAASQLDILRTIVSFSHGLTEAVHRHDPAAARGQLNSLLINYAGVLPLDRTGIEQIAGEAVETTKSTFDALRIPFDDLRLHRQTELALAAIDKPLAEESAGLLQTPPLPSEAVLEGFTEDIELSLCRDAGCDLNRIIHMVLEAIWRGGSFDRVVFGLVSADHRYVIGRLGMGPHIDPFIDSFRFPLSIRSGPIAVALMGKQDLFITDDRYANTIFGQTVGSAHFGLMPVIISGVPLGLFYFDRRPGGEEPSKETLHQLRRLRDLAAETIQRSRREAPSPA